MSEPLVSVIVPFHDQERYLAEAVESILVQNYEPIELLLVDDGSTDTSGAIARRYSPPAHYVHRRNGGAAAARNTGLLTAHGEFVAFCDSDDRWQREKLALQLDSFAVDPDLDVSFTGVHEFVTPELDPASLPARAPQSIASGVCLSSMLARRQVVSGVGQFDEQLRFGEWADWYARLLESGCKVAIRPEILVDRRLHDRNNSLARWRDRSEYARVFKRALDRRRNSGSTHSLSRRQSGAGMDQTTRFRVNTPQIIRETVEGEVLLIDLGTGNYYSLRSTGAVIWHAIEHGARVCEIVALLERAYEGENELEIALTRFLEELVTEKLVIPMPPGGEATIPLTETVVSGAPFEAPLLEKFTDMQELVLLDPVHDFGEAEGWPRMKPTG